MKIILWIAFSLASLSAGADIYKSVDSDGNVMFSDSPTPGAKKIQEQLTPTYASPPPSTSNSATPAEASYYTGLRIRKPSPGETLRDANGAVTIDLEVTPPLKAQAGHTLFIAVDGNKLAGHDNTTQFSISNLVPGPHTVQARIMDAAGQIQIRSASTTFFIQR